MGIRYNFERTPQYYGYLNQFAQSYCNKELYEDLYSTIISDDPETYHRSNFYYNGKVKNWSIDFNADGLWSDTKNTQTAKEDIKEGANEDSDRTVTTFNTNKNELYAAKLVLSHPFGKGELSFGAEYSHNKRNTTYFNKEGIIEDNQAMIKEGAASAFIEYAKAFNQVQMQLGLRYEHVGFDYYDAGKLVVEQSKNYSNLFPSITFGFPIKGVQVQFGYTSDIVRPDYWDLRSNATYVNRYMYSKGNPFLMPSITHNVTLAASYQWINLYVGYSHRLDDMIQHTVAYSEDDPTIAMFSILNGTAYDRLVASINISPTIGCWTPQLGLAMQKQWYEGETPQGKENFHKPMATVTLRNNFKLPIGFLLDVNGSWNTKGYSRNVYLEEHIVDMNASLYKSFFNDNLSVRLRASNIFEPKQVATIFSGIRVMRNTLFSHRQFTFTLQYKFNHTKSKYKGTGAGESQKSRM